MYSYATICNYSYFMDIIYSYVSIWLSTKPQLSTTQYSKILTVPIWVTATTELNIHRTCEGYIASYIRYSYSFLTGSLVG